MHDIKAWSNLYWEGRGKYAAYHFKGFPQFLFMVYQEIFCRWLSRTVNQLDEKRPIFDIYRVVGEDGYMEIDRCDFHPIMRCVLFFEKRWQNNMSL